MKMWKKIALFSFVWFVSSLVILCLAATIGLEAGMFYKLVVLIVPTTLAFSVSSDRARQRWKRSSFSFQPAHRDKFEWQAPDNLEERELEQEATEEVADKLYQCAGTSLEMALKEENFDLFVGLYEDAIEKYDSAAKYDISFKYPPDWKRDKLRYEFQLHACDAIVRAQNACVTKITTEYKNSKEWQWKALYDFETALNDHRPKFTPGTAELADKAVDTVRSVLSAETAKGKTSTSMDSMSGVEFETWCAEIMKKLGYHDVSMTKTSGDQGVDILAEKDGIKYAVQCKCYSKDLGNTPVQEVNTGKMFYKCHVGVVMTNRHFTQGAKEAAEATGTLLWDREKVLEMAKNAGMD